MLLHWMKPSRDFTLNEHEGEAAKLVIFISCFEDKSVGLNLLQKQKEKKRKKRSIGYNRWSNDVTYGYNLSFMSMKICLKVRKLIH